MAKGSKKGAVADLQKWVSEEYNNEAKFKANLRLVKALGIFFGSVVVFRSFGEALFAV